MGKSAKTHKTLVKKTLWCEISLRCSRHKFKLIFKDRHQGFPGGSEDKESACNARDLGSIPGLERSPGEGNGNPLQSSCLENPMDGGGLQSVG